MGDPQRQHPARALIHLDHLSHNLRLLRELAPGRPLWPAIKANAYGHDAPLIARHLVAEGCETLCVAHVQEATALLEAGIRPRFVVLSTTLAGQSECIVEHDLEPAVCTGEVVEALAHAAAAAHKTVSVHVMVDTGMGRVGVRPEELADFLELCRRPEIHIRGLMSHFPRAGEADQSFANEQLARFARVCDEAGSLGPMIRHMANSAAIFDLPDSHLDAVRPGIAIYGLAPSAEIANLRVRELRPVLEWQACITFLKEVPPGAGLSYGHTFRTTRSSLIATIPVGYGDGLSRRLSNDFDVLVGGVRCPQVGTITMDQTLVDVTQLRGRVGLGDAVVLLGRHGDETVTADEWAAKLGTINYEIVTAISKRIPRLAVADPSAGPGPIG